MSYWHDSSFLTSHFDVYYREMCSIEVERSMPDFYFARVMALLKRLRNDTPPFYAGSTHTCGISVDSIKVTFMPKKHDFVLGAYR